jgi:hypothetical protein
MRLSILAFTLLAACQGGTDNDDDTDGTDTEGTDTSDTHDSSGSDTGETGDSGVPWTEQAFAAPEARRQDILFVVDNSCSMQDNQIELSASMGGFVDTLDISGVDWRVGVTSTDVDVSYGNPLAGRLIRQPDGTIGVSGATTDAATVLGDMMRLGTLGSGEEKGIAATYLAAEVLKDTDNAGFFREDAGLHVVVLSDEQDQSDRMRPELIPLPEFIDWLEGSKATKPSVSFSSIVCPTAGATLGSGCLQFDVGTRYIEVSQAVGGIVADIAEPIDLPTYDVARAIVANSGLRTLPLDEVPADPSTIEVRVDGVALDPAEWSYDEVVNAVVLVEAAPDGSEVVVRFAP